MQPIVGIIGGEVHVLKGNTVLEQHYTIVRKGCVLQGPLYHVCWVHKTIRLNNDFFLSIYLGNISCCGHPTCDLMQG